MASVLPRTPGDINSILSVVFIGHGKFDPKRMDLIMKVRKSKVWQFSLWLKENNKLYHNIILDPELMELYSDKDDILPGITDHVIYDHQSDPNIIFEEETAGFCPQPASFMHGVNSPCEDKIIWECQIQSVCALMAELSQLLLYRI